MAKKKSPQTDGLGPRELEKISSALRQVWYRCHARKLSIKRCTDTDGFTVCELCKERTPKLKIDHIIPVGSIKNEGCILRLFCPSSGLQGLCHTCHKKKTKLETQARKNQSQKQGLQQSLVPLDSVLK